MLQGVVDEPANPNRSEMLAAALRETATTNPEFAQALAEATNAVPVSGIGTTFTTVTAGGDQRFRGMVNIGSGSLSVDRSRKRNTRIGLGALALLAVGGTTAAVIVASPDGGTASSPRTSVSVAAPPLGNPKLKQMIVPYPAPPAGCTSGTTGSNSCYVWTMIDLEAGTAVVNPPLPYGKSMEVHELMYGGRGLETTTLPRVVGYVLPGEPPSEAECQSQALAKSASGHGFDITTSADNNVSGNSREQLHNAYCLYPTHSGKTAFFRVDNLQPSKSGAGRIDLVLSYLVY